MEDSIALAAALARRRWDLSAAFVDYELERGPFVERTQDAASESAAYFGRIASYSHLEPIQFAFNLITRSGRITHATLGVRDPQFTRALDAWLGGRRGLAAAGVLAVRAPRRAVREPLRARRRARSRSARRDASPSRTTPRPDGKLLLRLTHAGRRAATQPRAGASTCRSPTAGRSSPRRSGRTGRSVRLPASRTRTPSSSVRRRGARCRRRACSSSTWRTAICSAATCRR